MYTNEFPYTDFNKVNLDWIGDELKTDKQQIVQNTADIEELKTGMTTIDYEDLQNLPEINSVTLIGDKSLEDIGAASADELNDVKSAIDYMADNGELKYPAKWEQGNLNGVTGQPIDASNAIRTTDYIGPGSYIIRPNGLRIYVYKFLTDGTRDGQLDWGATSPITIFVPETNKVRIVAARTDWANITPSECTVTVSQTTILSNLIYRENALDFISICHQGYSETGTVGHDLLSGYELAAKYGFDYAETDVKLSSDNVVMCCHDASFTDQTTGDTIVIADHTAAELKTYNFYGSTIATLDEVMESCKMNRIGLAIDQITPALLQYVFPVVKKYGMQRSVIYLGGWAAGNAGYATNVFNAIVAFDKKANIMFLCNTASVRSEMITWINALDKGDTRLYISCNSSAFSASDISAMTGDLNADVSIALYTVDDASAAKSYYPHITALTSNKISLSNILA